MRFQSSLIEIGTTGWKLVVERQPSLSGPNPPSMFVCIGTEMRLAIGLDNCCARSAVDPPDDASGSEMAASDNGSASCARAGEAQSTLIARAIGGNFRKIGFVMRTVIRGVPHARGGIVSNACRPSLCQIAKPLIIRSRKSDIGENAETL